MANGKTLCLNMIVKNEMANLGRCLRAVADHITCWVIGDTGSTDGTQDFVKSFFAERGIPGELHSFPFLNFGQARNAALEHAAASNLSYDYLLFADADMELVVEDRDFRAKLEEPGYRLIQKSDSLTYWNTRLVRRDAGARYHGVTHEYIDVPGGAKELRGVWYKDHASGSNRVEKFQRDIDLLSKALEQEPDNVRYWFYLAQSYRDAGQKAKAAEIYAKRAAMGGWDEEAWYARLQLARCLRDLKDDDGFIREALAAFNQRPQRAEPLYDLARFYRERGDTAVSAVFSEFGLTLPRPDDILFVEDFVYTAGLFEEYSIAANYARDPARKDRGHDACNWLALNRNVPSGTRNLARGNLRFYVQPASAMMPSFTAHPVGFTPPDGYHLTNPSIARLGEEIVMVQRAVNYIITGDNLYETPNGAPIHTRNFLLRLDSALDIQSSTEILPPADMPKPSFEPVLGFEDLRLFAWRGELWCSSTVRELTAEGWCDQVLARIDQSAPGDSRLTNWRVLSPEGPRLHEMNWMPLVDDDRLQFIYHCDSTRVLDEQARKVGESLPAIATERFRGGSQVIAFDGGWLALIHEVFEPTASQQRTYQHRWVWFDEARVLRLVSRAFYFHGMGVEFAAGLAWHPDGTRLMVSFSGKDQKGWIATVDADDVRSVLLDVERLPSGAPIIQSHEGHRADGIEQDRALPSDHRQFAIDKLASKRSRGDDSLLYKKKLLPTDFEKLARPFSIPNSNLAAPLAALVTGKARSDVLAAARALTKGGTFVEVGTWKGEFAERLCGECRPSKIYCVDPYEHYTEYQDSINTRDNLDEIFADARARLARFGDRVEFVRAFSTDAATKFADDTLDFVYIDGNHSFRFVLQDLRLWYPKLRHEGLMCLDDAVDTDDRPRNSEGDAEIEWLRNADGTVASGGNYGVLKAVRDFCNQRSIEFFLSGTQVLFQKPRG